MTGRLSADETSACGPHAERLRKFQVHKIWPGEAEDVLDVLRTGGRGAALLCTCSPYRQFRQGPR
jgi:hypothetical protein